MDGSQAENQMVLEDGFLTAAQVAESLSIGRTLVYSLMDRGELNYCRFGRTRRIPKKEVLRYVTEKMTKPHDENTTLPVGTSDML